MRLGCPITSLVICFSCAICNKALETEGHSNFIIVPLSFSANSILLLSPLIISGISLGDMK